MAHVNPPPPGDGTTLTVMNRPPTPLPLLLALLLPLSSPTAAEARETRSPTGPLVLIGGGSKPPAVLRRFVALAGGPGASLVVLPTASGEPDTGSYYQQLFREHTGARNVTVLEVRSPGDASRPEVVASLEEARGIFFSGGDQSRITAAFLGTPALAALRRAHARGAVVGGTSAGTACMSDPMLDGRGDPGVLRPGNIQLVPGLGLWPGVIVDQHFLARRRQGRLLGAVLENPGRLGFGIDEATAVLVRPSGVLEVLGEGWVWVYDARDAVVGQRPGQLGVRDLRVHVLVPGERFDLGEPGRPVPAR